MPGESLLEKSDHAAAELVVALTAKNPALLVGAGAAASLGIAFFSQDRDGHHHRLAIAMALYRAFQIAEKMFDDQPDLLAESYDLLADQAREMAQGLRHKAEKGGA